MARRRHIAMVITDGRVTCSCQLHPCPAAPQLGDHLCRVCRQHCAPEVVKRDKARKLKLALLVGSGLFALSWAAGHYLGPIFLGG